MSLTEFLHSSFSKVVYEMSPRSKDTMIGFDERMACKLMVAVLDTHEKTVMDKLVKGLEKYGSVSPRSRSPHILLIEGSKCLKQS